MSHLKNQTGETGWCPGVISTHAMDCCATRCKDPPKRTLYSDGTRLWSSDSLIDANGLKLAITTTDFLAALVITNSCLKYLQPVFRLKPNMLWRQ